MDADLRVGWTDWNMIKHLNNASWKDPVTGESVGNFTLDSEFLKEIWKPDVFIGKLYFYYHDHVVILNNMQM